VSTSASTTPASLRVLAVCTANVCRSPVAERLLHRHLTEAGHLVVVRSAGTHGGRLGVHRHTLAAAAALGLDLDDHRSRPLTAELLRSDGADLVVTMTREHLRHVVALDPAVWPRAFTLKELLRRSQAVGPSHESRGEWLAAVAAGRRAADLMRPDPVDDVADPYGGAASGHAAMVRELDEICELLARFVPH
jgi:protein-tyrosine phosphatase